MPLNEYKYRVQEQDSTIILDFTKHKTHEPFIKRHKKAIITVSAVVLASAILGVVAFFAWPAMATAILGFGVYGLSLGALAGANLIAQVGLVAAVFAVGGFIASGGLVAAGSKIINNIMKKWDDLFDKSPREYSVNPPLSEPKIEKGLSYEEVLSQINKQSGQINGNLNVPETTNLCVDKKQEITEENSNIVKMWLERDEDEDLESELEAVNNSSESTRSDSTSIENVSKFQSIVNKFFNFFTSPQVDKSEKIPTTQPQSDFWKDRKTLPVSLGDRKGETSLMEQIRKEREEKTQSSRDDNQDDSDLNHLEESEQQSSFLSH